MLKNYFFEQLSFLFILTFSPAILNAQQPEGQLLGDAPAPHKVMVIPFNQYNYFSDADPELANKNKKRVDELSTLFRYGLNYNVSTRVITGGTYNILTDTTLDSGKDLQMIYASVVYEYQKPMDAFDKDSAENKRIAEQDLFGNGGEQEKQEEKKISVSFKKEPLQDAGQNKYLNAVVKDPALFSSLQKKYGTDLFLFINQFELVTNFNHCLDRTENYFERKVIVHYTIYNSAGKQLKGDAITVTFSTAETNVDDIIGKNFPLIASFLDQSLTASIRPVQSKN